MPIWVYIYCSFIILAGIATIAAHASKPVYYIPGEILSVLISISFFLFYYEVLPKPPTIDIAVLLVLYLVYWESWENRHLYSLDIQADKTYDNGSYDIIEEYEYGDNHEDFADYEDYADYENDEDTYLYTLKIASIFLVITIIAVMSPLFYVIAMVTYSYTK